MVKIIRQDFKELGLRNINKYLCINNEKEGYALFHKYEYLADRMLFYQNTSDKSFSLNYVNGNKNGIKFNWAYYDDKPYPIYINECWINCKRVRLFLYDDIKKKICRMICQYTY